MNRPLLIALCVFALGKIHADTDVPSMDSGESRSESATDQDWEAKDIIPQGGVMFSTQPITPATLLPDQKPYPQALDDLAHAQDLLKKGNAEAASDISLQAYDNLYGLHMPRRTKKNKAKRQKLRDDRKFAATLYVDSSIQYIQEYVKKRGATPAAVEEGRARLSDLWDVAQNYPELSKKVVKARDAYGVQPSSPTITAAN